LTQCQTGHMHHVLTSMNVDWHYTTVTLTPYVTICQRRSTASVAEASLAMVSTPVIARQYYLRAAA